MQIRLIAILLLSLLLIISLGGGLLGPPAPADNLLAEARQVKALVEPAAAARLRGYFHHMAHEIQHNPDIETTLDVMAITDTSLRRYKEVSGLPPTAGLADACRAVVNKSLGLGAGVVPPAEPLTPEMRSALAEAFLALEWAMYK